MTTRGREPAYPQTIQRKELRPGIDTPTFHLGMSVRLYVASALMAGMFSGPGPTGTPEEAAVSALEAADALLKAAEQ